MFWVAWFIILLCSLQGGAGDINSTVLVNVIGIQPGLERSVWSDLVQLTQLQDNVYQLNNSNTIQFHHTDAPAPKQIDFDHAIIFIHRQTLQSESVVVSRFLNAIRSLKTLNVSKVSNPLLVITLGDSARTEEVLKKLFLECWEFDHPGTVPGVSLEIFHLNSLDTAHANSHTVKRIQAHLDSIRAVESSPKLLKQKSRKLAPKQSIQGFETCQIGIAKAVAQARSAASKHLLRIQKVENAAEFPAFVRDLLQNASKVLDSSINGTIVHKAVKQRAVLEIQRLIFAMILPVYKRQVQLARVAVTQRFNAAVAPEELPISVHLMEDLHDLRNDAIQELKMAIKCCTPAAAPVRSTWNVAFELDQLKVSIDDYIETRSLQGKLLGFLPRGRKPVALHINALLNHPFHRDYRQDVIGSGVGDKFFARPATTTQAVPLVPPSEAFDALKSGAKHTNTLTRLFGWRRWLGSDARRSELAEFSREMTMLPMFVKNPDVAMMGPRTRRKVGPAQHDPHRATKGPERFIRWDLEPLRTAAENAAKIASQSKSSHKISPFSTEDLGFVDSVLARSILAISSQISKPYVHPAINYGEKFSPNWRAKR